MNFYPSIPEQPTSSFYRLDSGDYELVVRQQPREALVTQEGKEKNRKPIDPPPIVEIKVPAHRDPIRQFLQSPYLFMMCSLVPADSEEDAPSSAGQLTGQLVSSLHRLKDVNNEDGGFFVFGDISVKTLGTHRLKFSLFEMQRGNDATVFLKSVLSEPFKVVPAKQWQGLEESTYLSRAFSDQGVRLRLRKESRTMGGRTKRTFPFSTPDPVQAGPSTAVPEQQTGMYGSGSGGGQYGSYVEPAPKRPRSDDWSQPSVYASSAERAAHGYGARSMVPSLASNYVPSGGAGQSPQSSYGMRTPTAPHGWQYGYTQGTASAPARVDSNVRAAQGMTPTEPTYYAGSAIAGEFAYSRRPTDSYGSSGAHQTPNDPYQSTESIYAQQAGLPSQSGPGSTSSVHTPTSTRGTVLNPQASAFQPQPHHTLPSQHYTQQQLPSQAAFAGLAEGQYPFPQHAEQYRQQHPYQQPSQSLLLQQHLPRPPDSGEQMYGQAPQIQQYNSAQDYPPSEEGSYHGSSAHHRQWP